MSLEARIRREFANKEYPNPNNPGVVRKMRAAQKLFGEQYLKVQYPWVLNGESISHDGWFATHDPADKSVVGWFPTYDAGRMALHEHLPRILEAGRRFARTVSWKDRVRLLVTISQVAKERFWLLCAAKAHEQGQQTMEQIGETDEEVDFPLANAWYLERLHDPKMGLVPSPAFAGDVNGKRFIPHGVFLNVSPFNFPGAIPMDMATKALAMGNAFIEKSSPKSALSGYLVFETIKIAFERCGIDWRGVVNYAPGGADVVNAMLASPYIAGCSFTGSSSVLRDIKRTHGEMLRYGFSGTKAPLIFGSAETSGVNPFVVCPDADIEYCALEYVKAVVGRMGQKCSSARLAFVHRRQVARFMQVVGTKLDGMKYGDVKTGADIGPLASQGDVDKLREQIRELSDKGVTEMCYQKLGCEIGGYDFAPTILMASDTERHGHALMNTELFGPVSTIVPYTDIEQVETLLRMSEFALTGSIMSNDPVNIQYFLDVLPAGNVYLNRKCTGALVETECFGGLRSQSSPSGIKGVLALALFGSQQTVSGYLKNSPHLVVLTGRDGVLENFGFVLSKP